MGNVMYIQVHLAFYIWPSSSYSLTSFQEWMEGAKLVLGMGKVVRITLKREGGAEFDSCRECRELLLSSDIIHSAWLLNWRSLEDIILKHLVSLCILHV